MKRIYTTANLQEAYLIMHMLGDAGIQCHIFNEDLQGGLGELPFTHIWPEIWIVNETDGKRALDIIHDFEHSAVNDAGGVCRSCGEDNPSTFEICWNCGRNLTRS